LVQLLEPGGGIRIGADGFVQVVLGAILELLSGGRARRPLSLDIRGTQRQDSGQRET